MPRVLLIEDSATQSERFAMMLRTGGFDVEVADTLTRGLERIEKGGIDTLLLDLNLPDSEGLNTFRSAFARSAGIPIVVLTHVDDEELASTTLQQGAQDYLVKGEVNQSWLVRAIQNSIARRKSDSRRAASEPSEGRQRSESVLHFEPRGDVTIARVKEKQLIDPRVLNDLSSSLLRRITNGSRKLIVALSHVEYISNGAIGVLLIVRRRMLAQNGRFCLCEPRDGVADQFAARQFHRLFEIYPSCESALASVGREPSPEND